MPLPALGTNWSGWFCGGALPGIQTRSAVALVFAAAHLCKGCGAFPPLHQTRHLQDTSLIVSDQLCEAAAEPASPSDSLSVSSELVDAASAAEAPCTVSAEGGAAVRASLLALAFALALVSACRVGRSSAVGGVSRSSRRRGKPLAGVEGPCADWFRLH